MDKCWHIEQNEHFLSAFFFNFKKYLFFWLSPKKDIFYSQHPLSPFLMLQYAPWTLWPGYNIEKGRGARNGKITHWKTQAFNETGLFRGVSQLLLSRIVGLIYVNLNRPSARAQRWQLRSISVSGQLRTYPSPNPTCYNKLVLLLG